MQNGASHIKDSNDSKDKIKNIDILNDAPLVTADFVELYASIPHKVGLSPLREALDKNLVKRAEFILKNNFFEFYANVYQQISGSAIGTNFAPFYA